METLKSKLGPFPVWVWLVIVTGALLAWYLWAKHKSGGSSSLTGSSAAPEVVVQTGGETSPNQSTTPTPEPKTHDLSAAQRDELADAGLKDPRKESEAAYDRQFNNRGKARDWIADRDRRRGGKKKKDKDRPARHHPPTRPGKTPPPGGGGASARHLATTHPVGD